MQELTATNREHEAIEAQQAQLSAAYKKACEKHDSLVEELRKTKAEMASLAEQKLELTIQSARLYKKQANGKGKK